MTGKQEVRYRTGRNCSATNCGLCVHIVESPGTEVLREHQCRVLGLGVTRHYTVTRDGVCDRFEQRPSKYKF